MSESILAELASCQLSLPFALGEPPRIPGQIKATPEDFVVEEVPAYLPSGSGEHLYLWIEKRGRNTQDVSRALEQRLGAAPRSSGWAGLKDRSAVTRQWLSFHCASTPRAEELELEGVRVLEVSRHANKLRTGHLNGNRFTLRVRSVPSSHDADLARALESLSATGIPNYFGAQRFGHEGKNLTHAYRWVAEAGRAPPSPFLRKLNVSVLQSALFNAWLAARIRRHGLASALAGDVMRKEETGGLFVSEAPEVDLPRVKAWEISATGPMFGAKMRAPAAVALEEEQAILSQFAVSEERLRAVQSYGEGTRRPARVRALETKWAREGDDIVLSFTLPKGAYATVLLRELLGGAPSALGEEDAD